MRGPFTRSEPFKFSRVPRTTMGWKISFWFVVGFEKIVKNIEPYIAGMLVYQS